MSLCSRSLPRKKMDANKAVEHAFTRKRKIILQKKKNCHEPMSMNSFEGVAFCSFPTILSANKGSFSNSTLVHDNLTALHR